MEVSIRGSREETGGLDLLKTHKNIGFLINTRPAPLKITKLSSRWWPSYPLGPSLTKLPGSAHGKHGYDVVSEIMIVCEKLKIPYLPFLKQAFNDSHNFRNRNR